MSEALDTNTLDRANTPYDVEAVRADFPILARRVYDRPLVYLDNGASAQKPRAMIDAVRRSYELEYSNVHRGAHYLSGLATDHYEGAREAVARLLNAAEAEEIAFTRNATESINLIAHSFVAADFKPGDEVVISEMEHHANVVPWLMLRDRIGLTLRVAPIAEDGSLRMDALADLLGERTKLVAITHTSNVLGTATDAKAIARMAHDAGAKVMFDGAQGVVHRKVDVQDIDADFYVFTGHKLYGPSGIGVLYGKRALLEAMPPFLGGGEMIDSVSFDGVTFKEAPHKFEAGTPPITQAVGLAAAIDYVSALGIDAIAAHEHSLLEHATERMQAIDGLRILGNAPGKAAIVSFLVEGLHPYDMATILDRDGVAVRVGHHCAEPLMKRLGVEGTARASFGLYNTHDEVEMLAASIEKAKKLLG